MQRSLEQALGRADDVIGGVQQRPPKGSCSSRGEKSLHEKLYDIYVEECEKEPEVGELRSNVNLLEKLLKREPLPCLVFSLFPDNHGYSLMIKDKNGALSESIALPHAGRELLEYLEAEELPPFLLNVLENSPVNLFHHGCVIAEIRDYRQCSNVEPPPYQSRHILLRPTMQTLAWDVEAMTSDEQQWTQEEKLELESQLILATADPLCLDPSVTVTCTANRLLYNKQKMRSDQMRRCLKRNWWPSVNWQEELPQRTAPPELATLMACKKRAEMKAGPASDLKIEVAGKCVDTWKQRPCKLAIPSQVDVQKYAKGRQSVLSEDSDLTHCLKEGGLRDDFDLEREADCQPWESKMSVMKSPNDPFLCDETWPGGTAGWESQMCLPQDVPGDRLHSVRAKANAATERAVAACQESVQRQEVCPGQMTPESRGSASLSKASSEKKLQLPTTSWVVSSASLSEPGQRVTVPPAPVTPPSSSGQSGLDSSRPALQSSSSQRLRRLAPAPAPAPAPPPMPAILAQVCNIVGSGGNPPPEDAQLPSGSSESNPATQDPTSAMGLKILGMVRPVQGVPLLVSGPAQVPGSPLGAPAPAGVPPRSLLPLGGQLPSAPPQPTPPQPQPAMQVIMNNTLSPLTVQIPPGSFILNPQPMQPQPQPQAQMFLLVPQPQLQPPIASLPAQPASRACAQGSSSQQWAGPSQQAFLLNIAGVEGFVQPQAAVMCQLGSTQQSPALSLAPQAFQLSVALPQQPRSQGAQQRLEQGPGSMGTEATQGAQPHQLGHTAGQPKGTAKGTPSTTPKP